MLVANRFVLEPKAAASKSCFDLGTADDVSLQQRESQVQPLQMHCHPHPLRHQASMWTLMTTGMELNKAPVLLMTQVRQ